jgi:hypothetical protein
MLRALFTILILSFAATAHAESPMAILGGSSGEVVLWRDGKSYRMVPGTPLRPSDDVQTGPDGKARVVFKEDTVLTIGPRSRVKLESFALSDERQFSVKVLAGRFKISVAKWLLGPTQGNIETPTAVAGVRGTVVWGDTELDAVCALEGEVKLKPKKGENNGVALKAGDCVSKMEAGKTEPIHPTPADLKKFLAEVTID